MTCDTGRDIQYRTAWRGGKVWIQKQREPSEFRQILQLKIEKSDLYLKMTALVKLLYFWFRFFCGFKQSDKVTEFRQSVRQILSLITTFLKFKLLVSTLLFEGKVSEFRQFFSEFRQVLCWIQTINCLADPLTACRTACRTVNNVNSVRKCMQARGPHLGTTVYRAKSRPTLVGPEREKDTCARRGSTKDPQL